MVPETLKNKKKTRFNLRKKKKEKKKVDRAQKLERLEECSLSTIVLDIEQRWLIVFNEAGIKNSVWASINERLRSVI